MIGRASYHILDGSHGPQSLNTNQLLKTLGLWQERWELTVIGRSGSRLARSLIDDNSKTSSLNSCLHTPNDYGLNHPSHSRNKTKETGDVREDPWGHQYDARYENQQSIKDCITRQVP